MQYPTGDSNSLTQWLSFMSLWPCWPSQLIVLPVLPKNQERRTKSLHRKWNMQFSNKRAHTLCMHCCLSFASEYDLSLLIFLAANPRVCLVFEQHWQFWQSLTTTTTFWVYFCSFLFSSIVSARAVIACLLILQWICAQLAFLLLSGTRDWITFDTLLGFLFSLFSFSLLCRSETRKEHQRALDSI